MTILSPAFFQLKIVVSVVELFPFRLPRVFVADTSNLFLEMLQIMRLGDHVHYPGDVMWISGIKNRSYVIPDNDLPEKRKVARNNCKTRLNIIEQLVRGAILVVQVGWKVSDDAYVRLGCCTHDLLHGHASLEPNVPNTKRELFQFLFELPVSSY